MILVVDSHGFTTRILTHQLGAVHVVTVAELSALNLADYTHVVIGHGSETVDLAPLDIASELPVLAIGSASQHLAARYGHETTDEAQPVYGQPVTHWHAAQGLFAQLSNPVELISYHAWRLDHMNPEMFEIEATDDNGLVLAFRVRGTNHWGLHAEPAALQSTAGARLIENFLALAPTRTEPVAASSQTAPQRQRYELYTRELTGELDTAATFATLQDGASAAFWLDSAAAHLGQGALTMMGTNAGKLSQTIRWDVTTNTIDLDSAGTVERIEADVFDYLTDHAWDPAEPGNTHGFHGGWVGYLGYEAKQATVAGHVNRWEAPTPDAYWIRPQTFIRYDHQAHTTTLYAYHDPMLLDELETVLVWGTTKSPEPVPPSAVGGRWRLEPDEYEQRVAQIQDLLKSGRAAGICLTDTFCMDAAGLDGLELYFRLRAQNPAPYAAYLRLNTFDDDIEVLSASPEKYLSIDAAGTIESKPIKGTVARSNDPQLDVDIAAQMAIDPKIQSENLMIADVLRDDLAAVTVAGSIQVPKLMAVESFATVHQLVTTVTGQLLRGISAPEALKAVFPGGSMTGAPKRVSLTVLDELETGPRGIYSGAIGWIGDNNTAECNVVIRSIVIADGQLTIGAGGAVVVDSDPAAEEQEKHLKARAQLRSIAEQL